MNIIKRHAKRVIIDTAGYFLIVAGVALGWLPGPGGVPLVLIGLALLSIHNKWAETLRSYILKHSGKFIDFAFPAIPAVQWFYDVLSLLLTAIVILLSWRRNAVWQISLAIFLFFATLLIITYNRDRFGLRRRNQQKHKH